MCGIMLVIRRIDGVDKRIRIRIDVDDVVVAAHNYCLLSLLLLLSSDGDKWQWRAAVMCGGDERR